ncbi:MAG: M56 family metallopeptidase, partial [Oscillospiraceae bacterium]|nr:M56 family metallopeptidase [Oscillospiraceae bacterium]
MNEVLKVILSVSVSGGLAALVLLVFKPLYKNRLKKSWQYYIWLIVLLRMILPFTPE